MKKITRALCLMLAVILCVGLFAGCHPKDEIALDFGDYKISLILSGTMMFIVLIALQIVFRSGEKQREVTINKEKKYEDSKG